MTQGIERVIRSDSGVAHRLSLSARVLSAVVSQVKAKRRCKKRLWRQQNRHAHEFQSMPDHALEPFRFDRIETGLHLTGFRDANRFPPRINSGAGSRLQTLGCTESNESRATGTLPSSACFRAAAQDQPNTYYPGNIYIHQAVPVPGSRGGGDPEPPGERTQRSPAQSSS